MRGRSSLFLMEQLIVIAVFAICAAVCVKIMFIARTITVDAVDTRYALLIAESEAEGFKRLEKTEGVAHFVKQACEKFSLEMRVAEDSGVELAHITIVRISDEKPLVSLTSARRMGL